MNLKISEPVTTSRTRSRTKGTCKLAIHFNESENEISQINLDDLAALLRSRMNGLQPFESRIEQKTETMLPSHKTITAATVTKQY